MPAPHPLTILAVCGLLAGCEGEDAIARHARQQALTHPPVLWSIAVVEGGVETARVTLCADNALRAGFHTPLPMIGGQACGLTQPPRIAPGRARMRCELGGRAFEVEAFTRGDPERDFSVDLRMRGLDAERLTLSQTRRYRRLGPCPGGWGVGDNTDRQGHRRRNALR